MSSRLAQAIEQTTSRSGRPCSMCGAYGAMSDEDRAFFDRWMAGETGYSDAQMHAALQENGYRVAKQTIGHHRRRSCSGFSA